MSGGRASWRVAGLINPVWQLPDALSGSSPPSLSHARIPASPGSITSMIYKLDNNVNSAATLALFIRHSSLSNLSVSSDFLHIFCLSLRRNCKDVWPAGPRGRKPLKCLCVRSCLTIGVILMADLCVVQPMLEQQICVLGCADPSQPCTPSRPSGDRSAGRRALTGHSLQRGVTPRKRCVSRGKTHTLARAQGGGGNKTLELRWGLREVGSGSWSTICSSYAAFL